MMPFLWVTPFETEIFESTVQIFLLPTHFSIVRYLTLNFLSESPSSLCFSCILYCLSSNIFSLLCLYLPYFALLIAKVILLFLIILSPAFYQLNSWLKDCQYPPTPLENVPWLALFYHGRKKKNLSFEVIFCAC